MYRTGVAVLCFVQIDRATVPIELTNFNGVLLAQPHPSMNRSYELREMLREAPRNRVMEFAIFFSAQEAEQPLGFLRMGLLATIETQLTTSL